MHQQTKARPLLLGIADRVNPRGSVNPEVATDILGLRQVVASHIYPLDIQNYQVLIGFPVGSPPSGRIRLFMRERPSQNVWLQYAFSVGDAPPEAITQQIVVSFSLRTDLVHPMIWQPGTLEVRLELNGDEHDLNFIKFVYVPAPPLSNDIRHAIKSNPSLWSELRMVIQCSKCKAGITPEVGPERFKPEAQDERFPNPTWYEDLPDDFKCECGTTSVPLRYLRESMHWFLANTSSVQADGSVTIQTSLLSLPEAEKVLGAFRRLLDGEPPESKVQSFIQTNPMLLAPFAARQLFFKPPILNKYAADFGIVTSRRELLLIEIERPNLHLLKADGSQHSELTHAFSQVQMWNHEITENRAAVLRCIPQCPTDIATVRYLVIAGRSTKSDTEALTRLLRSSTFCGLMTYDHLIEDARNAIRQAIA